MVDKKVLYEIPAAVQGKNKDDRTTKEIYLDIAYNLMSRYTFKVLNDTREILVYNEETGVYSPEKGKILQFIHKELREESTPQAERDIMHHIIAACMFDRSEICGAVRVKECKECHQIISMQLHVQNGWLDLETLQLFPHTPDIISTSTLAVHYNKNAVAGQFIKIMKEALPREYCMLFIKTIGNLLVPDCRFEKITYCVGKGHNRKSTLVKAVVLGILGKANFCNIPPQAFAKDRFAAADLDGKIANVVFDLEAYKITDAGVLKTVISGDPIRVQRKYGQPYTIRPIAKHIMIANDIPETDDNTHGYWRRQNVIPFYTTFEEDRNIETRLSTDSERSGILNLMICGMRKLLQDGFDEIDVEKVRRLYEYNGLTVREFLENECIINIEDESRKNTTLAIVMQTEYIAFETKRRSRPLDTGEQDYLVRILGEELKKLGVKKRALGPRGQQKNHYVGIQLKSCALAGQRILGKP